jgi:hypothetical protein
MIKSKNNLNLTDNKKFICNKTYDYTNFYENNEVKKICKPSIDLQVKYSGVKLNSRIAIIGGSGTGKTNGCINLIKDMCQPEGTFINIIVVYKTDEKLYSYLKKKIPQLIMIKDINLLNIDDFDDQELKDPEDRQETLIIFDDFIADKDKNVIDQLEKFCIFGRKKGLTLIFLAQYFYAINIVMRAQLNYLIFLETCNKRNFNLICSTYGLVNSDVSQDDINIMMKDSLDKFGQTFKINLNTNDLNKKYSRNGIDYFKYYANDELNEN